IGVPECGRQLRSLRECFGVAEAQVKGSGGRVATKPRQLQSEWQSAYPTNEFRCFQPRTPSERRTPELEDLVTIPATSSLCR
ncbi:hypothetical protein E3U43_015493, partial [Larimichthys crocea]